MVPLLCQLFTFEKFSAVLTSAGFAPYLSLSIRSEERREGKSVDLSV